MKDLLNELNGPANRRSFLKKGLTVAGTAALGAGMLAKGLPAVGQGRSGSGSLTNGDAAMLRFVNAIELIEADLWQQYAELGGVTDGVQNNYQLALQFLDGDAGQYITSNTLDEISHAAFLEAYLISKGAEPVNLDPFRTLHGSRATGAQKIGRLTNLTQLNVDTSWYTRDRSTTNPDFGAQFPQSLSIVNRKAIPTTNADFTDPNHIQAIANTAAFHFAFIEQGGSSLYAILSGKASSREVERILVSIGGSETSHFQEWVDFAGNAVQGPPYSFNGAQSPITDNGLTFPNFNNPPFGGPLFQTNLIFPVACEFISPNLPQCAVIRPTLDVNGGAVATVNAFTNDGLFIGQSQAFLELLFDLASAADEANR